MSEFSVDLFIYLHLCIFVTLEFFGWILVLEKDNPVSQSCKHVAIKLSKSLIFEVIIWYLSTYSIQWLNQLFNKYQIAIWDVFINSLKSILSMHYFKRGYKTELSFHDSTTGVHEYLKCQHTGASMSTLNGSVLGNEVSVSRWYLVSVNACK